METINEELSCCLKAYTMFRPLVKIDASDWNWVLSSILLPVNESSIKHYVRQEITDILEKDHEKDQYR